MGFFFLIINFVPKSFKICYTPNYLAPKGPNATLPYNPEQFAELVVKQMGIHLQETQLFSWPGYYVICIYVCTIKKGKEWHSYMDFFAI